MTPVPKRGRFGRKRVGIAPKLHEAELALIRYVTESVDNPWFDLIDDAQLDEVMAGVDRIFAEFPGTAYEPPEPHVLQALVERLTLERPPIRQTLARDGAPTNHHVPAAHCLYAGWTFWFGREALIAEGRRTDPEVRPADLGMLVTDGRGLYRASADGSLSDLTSAGQLAFAFVLDLRAVRSEVEGAMDEVRRANFDVNNRPLRVAAV